MQTRLFASLLVEVVFTMLGVVPSGAQNSNFTPGTAVGTELPTCSADLGGVPGNCWGLNVSCQNVTSFLPYDATAKVTTPSGQSLGTIIFITGGGGTLYYDTYFAYGTQVI